MDKNGNSFDEYLQSDSLRSYRTFIEAASRTHHHPRQLPHPKSPTPS